MQTAAKPRGFAAMSLEKRRLIAKLGGKQSQACGRGHRFNLEEAKAASKKAVAARRARKQP